MSENYKHIEVAVALPVFGTYTYRIAPGTESQVTPGKRVLIPFGRRQTTGYVLSFRQDSGRRETRLILDILDDAPLFPASMIPFFKWVSEYYLHPLGEVIKTALPGGINLGDHAVAAITDRGERRLSDGAHTPIERALLERLCRRQTAPLKTLGEGGKPPSQALIRKMSQGGLITVTRQLSGGKTGEKTERYIAAGNAVRPVSGLTEKRADLVSAVRTEGEIPLRKLKELFPSAPSMIKPLAATGHIEIIERAVIRDPFGEAIEPDTPPSLTDEQRVAVETVTASLGNGFESFLLAGVTGSGKTEVYMHITQIAVEKGFSVIILVPEIALISQTERRFRARFGECIAVLHSGLSKGERYDQWRRIAADEVSIVIGARSAIFAPLEKIGVIIVDEEHDASYKQESTLRYNARDLAVVRARFHGGCAVLGSATPSVQSSYNAAAGKFTEVTLKNRVNRQPLPEITVVDLRSHRLNRNARGIRRFMTPELIDSLRETLANGEQALVFLNRRGFATSPVCGACGETVKCKNCDISLTLHKKANAYRCHLCGYMMAAATPCLTCSSTNIRLMGLGTEQVEEAVAALFPEARVDRLDQDTTGRKGSVLRILKGLKTGKTDILVGTQMVAKGHDFPNITLVGIICADLSLSFPDFRAGEQTFQLLAQVAGRAGRGEKPGRVILQTYNPDHFSITAARSQDFKAFYSREIEFRQGLGYPPFSRMIQLKISGKDKRKTARHAEELGDRCHLVAERLFAGPPELTILGPVEASMAKVANRYRWQILLKSPSHARLRHFVQELLFSRNAPAAKGDLRVVVDVDPFSMM